MFTDPQKIPLFTGLTAPAQNFVMRQGIQNLVGSGQLVAREGDRGDQMYVIVSGQVRITKNFGQPNETLLAELGEGDFFGEMCLLETLPRSATVQAVTYTQLISWPSLAFYQLYQAMPKDYGILLLNMARDLSRRLRKLDENFADRR